jgi:hypothetical protein
MNGRMVIADNARAKQELLTVSPISLWVIACGSQLNAINEAFLKPRPL